MSLTRRDALRGGTATLAALAAGGAVTARAAVDPEITEVARLFTLLTDGQRAATHNCIRMMVGLDLDPALKERAARVER
jgi:hypothetical protein